MTKSEIKQMLDDLKTYSGHIVRFRRLKTEKTISGCCLTGTIVTSQSEFRFMVFWFRSGAKARSRTRTPYWTVHLENAESSIDSGGVYSPYTFPKIGRNAELRRRVVAANEIISVLSDSRRLPETDFLQHCYEIVGMPKGLSREAKLRFCIDKVKHAHRPKADYSRN